METEKLDNRLIFAGRLRGLRLSKGLNQKELAARLGIGQTAVANYEQGIRFPEDKILLDLAQTLETSLDYLLGRDFLTDKPVSFYSDTASWKQFLELLLAGKKDDARLTLIQIKKSGKPLSAIYKEFLAPLLWETGDLWEKGNISTAEEHFISEEIIRIMSILKNLDQPKQRNLKTCVCLCASGELHAIGLRMFCDLLEIAGWKTHFLGTNTPARDIISYCSLKNADLLALSATMPHHIEGIRAIVAALRANPSCSKTKVLVGGSAFRNNADLYKDLGADGYAPEAEEGIRIAEELVRDP